MFSRIRINKSMNSYLQKIEQVKTYLEDADAVIIGAGAGLSTSAGFVYSGEHFSKYFSDFSKNYHFSDMYSGGFYPYETLEEHWAYWSRYIYINRYRKTPKPVYENLFKLVKDKDYFVLTTNVDHCFQKAGFDKHRLFYTQGDYGLWQCSKPCHKETYENEETILQMIQAQGYELDETGDLFVPDGKNLKMSVPSELVPYCPKCGRPMSMNLRADSTFVEDSGWEKAARRYEEFIRRHKGLKIVFLELGVGYNTPIIIKYPFWQFTAENPKAVYVCVNQSEAGCPREIENQSVCMDFDIGEVIEKLL